MVICRGTLRRSSDGDKNGTVLSGLGRGQSVSSKTAARISGIDAVVLTAVPR